MTPEQLADYLINDYEIQVAKNDYEGLFDALASDDMAPEGTYTLELVAQAVKIAREDPYIRDYILPKFDA